MDLSAWLLFATTIMIASISPGPNILMVIMQSLTHGISGGFWTIIGNLLCLFCVALIASIGVGAALSAMPVAFTIMKIAGGLYLAWIGFKMIRSSFGPLKPLHLSKESDGKNFSRSRLMMEAFLVSASNPKSILFLTAVFPQFLDVTKPVIPQFSIMFGTIILIVSVIHSSYGALALSMQSRPISEGFRRWIQRITGGTFIGLGAGVALTK